MGRNSEDLGEDIVVRAFCQVQRGSELCITFFLCSALLLTLGKLIRPFGWDLFPAGAGF